MDYAECYYQPGKPGIIDIALAIGDGTHRGLYGGETLAEVQMRYPGAAVGNLDAVVEASRKMFERAPKRVTESRFLEMLNVLPPENWVRGNGCESFKMCEYEYDNVTTIFARIGGEYYEMAGRASMPHHEIVEACKLLGCLPEVNA